MVDPVHHDEGGWWFWDETEANRLGPFVDEVAARKALAAYCEWLDPGVNPPRAHPPEDGNPVR